MASNRMEAFSDGILAIIITIMVLKLNPPQTYSVGEIKDVALTLVAYILSYIYVGIYWANHHHLVKVVDSVSGRVLWMNLHWLFWMSLIPMATEWVGLSPFEEIPTLFYGFILFMCAISYNILQKAIVKKMGQDSILAKTLGRDVKGKLSILSYALAIVLALFYPVVATIVYMLVAAIWFAPDRRLERIFYEED